MRQRRVNYFDYAPISLCAEMGAFGNGTEFLIKGAAIERRTHKAECAGVASVTLITPLISLGRERRKRKVECVSVAPITLITLLPLLYMTDRVRGR